MAAKHKQIIDQDFQGLNDDLIGDIIPVKIDARMPVSTLHALETIFYMRLQLAQVSWAENAPIYESLCRNRFQQIANALIEKYPTVETLNEKIMILNRLENISQTLHGEHSDFVVEERLKLLNAGSLTFTQRYRLDNLLEFNYDNVNEDIDRLLAEARTTFDIAILFDIDTLGTEAQYDAVTERFKTMFDRALAESDALGMPKGTPHELAEGNARELTKGNAREIADLLAVAADTNNDPLRRTLLASLTAKAHSLFTSLTVQAGLTLLDRANEVHGGISMNNGRAYEAAYGIGEIESRANEIAAEVYDRIDTLTGKYLAADPDGPYIPTGTYAPIPA